MNLLLWILAFCFLGGLLSVMVAALYLVLPETLRNRLLPHLVSFAIGALLGAALLALLPHALGHSEVVDFHKITGTLLLGLLSFFLLEKIMLWRHCHVDHCEVHAPDEHHGLPSTTALIVVGDGIHNFVDGILIGAAFLTDIHLGIVTSLAVAAHEIPQEVGDFAILLHSGCSRGKALAYNVLASLATVVGGLVAFFSLKETAHFLPYVLTFAASSFLYIAVADLIPGLHRRVQFSATLQQLALIAAGVAVIYAVHSTLH